MLLPVLLELGRLEDEDAGQPKGDTLVPSISAQSSSALLCPLLPPTLLPDRLLSVGASRPSPIKAGRALGVFCALAGLMTMEAIMLPDGVLLMADRAAALAAVYVLEPRRLRLGVVIVSGECSRGELAPTCEAIAVSILGETGRSRTGACCAEYIAAMRSTGGRVCF